MENSIRASIQRANNCAIAANRVYADIAADKGFSSNTHFVGTLEYELASALHEIRSILDSVLQSIK